jgi:hypothetical protein
MIYSKQLLLGRVALVVLSASACLPFGFGDPLHEVDIENTTGVAVRIYQDGARRALPLDVSAHATAQTAFAWPIDSSDGRVRMILVEDATGRRVYCERFRYVDLVKVDWKIKVIERDLCG